MSADISLDDIGDDLPRYTPLAYLRDRWGSALIGALLIAGLCLTLPVLGVGFQACVLVVAFALLCMIAEAVIGYLRRAAYYHDATMYVRQIGAVCQYTALVCVLVVAFALLCMIAEAVIGYLRRAAYYHDATMYVRQIGAVCQYTALVDAPSFLEGRIMHRSIDVIGYLRRAAYYHDATMYVRQIGAVCQYTALVDAPSFLEGRIMHRSIERLAFVAEKENADEREQARAHREYIELWIHEVKTPLAAAKLMLAGMHGEQALKLKGEMERIETQVDQALYSARAISLANDYLIKSIPLADVVRAACKKNMHALVNAGISLDIAVGEDVNVLADEPWLTFILSQIVGNAAKYGARTISFTTREEEPALDIAVGEDVNVLADEPWLTFILSQIVGNAAKYGARTISFTTREEEPATPRGRTVLEVRDDGIGIPAADVPRVFERGFTGSAGRSTGAATGMGLYLVATMCEEMGLGIGIGSEEGVGTRLVLSFPHDRRRLRANEAR